MRWVVLTDRWWYAGMNASTHLTASADAPRSRVTAALRLTAAHACGAALHSIRRLGGAIPRAAAVRRWGSALVAVDLATATASAGVS